MDYSRAITLLKARLDLLSKQDGNYYVLNLMMETVFYDGEEYDGYCLMEDIRDYLGLEE